MPSGDDAIPAILTINVILFLIYTFSACTIFQKIAQKQYANVFGVIDKEKAKEKNASCVLIDVQTGKPSQ